MTSKLTRERIEQIVYFRRTLSLPPSHDEIEELARMALAAMDSEPVAVPDHLTYLQSPTLENVLSDAEENSPMAHAARILAREVKFWRSVPLYRHAQPAPETEREPIAWLNDAYLARGVVDGEAGSEDVGPGYIPVYREASPAQPAPVLPDYFASLVAAARVRADKAMRKFPQPNYVLNKVAEESGEVIKAVIHYTEGREEWSNVEAEIIDNLAMLLRLVKEGDQVIGFTPPVSCRAAMLNGGKS